MSKIIKHSSDYNLRTLIPFYFELKARLTLAQQKFILAFCGRNHYYINLFGLLLGTIVYLGYKNTGFFINGVSGGIQSTFLNLLNNPGSLCER